MKKCPFCGSKRVEENIDKTIIKAVGCSSCGARGPYAYYQSGEDLYQSAIDLWNVRHTVDSDEEETASLSREYTNMR